MTSGITKRNLALILGKGAVGAIPIVGALAVEVVNTLIPDRRVTRLEELVAQLAEKLAAAGQTEERVRARFTEPDFIDLLEAGMEQAARTAEAARVDQLAALLKNALLDDDLNRLQDKRLLQILEQLNDAEVVTLYSNTMKARSDEELRDRHSAILAPKHAFIGAPQSDIDAATLQKDRRDHLAQLGLLAHRFTKPRKGEVPEFDDATGTLKPTFTEVSPLGRLLLRRIDLLGPKDW